MAFAICAHTFLNVFMPTNAKNAKILIRLKLTPMLIRVQWLFPLQPLEVIKALGHFMTLDAV